jgi:hypothetical protein
MTEFALLGAFFVFYGFWQVVLAQMVRARHEEDEWSRP